ncbi:MAG: glycosyltransferase [Planctomycetota bacterium]
MIPRKRILFVGEATTLAHVVRPLELAKALDPWRFEIHFACDERYRNLVESAGFDFHSLPTMPAEEFARRLSVGAPLYDRGTLNDYVTAEMDLLSELEPDLVVGDFRVSLGISTEVMGIPYANLCNAHWSPCATQRFPLPELPAVGTLGEKLTGLCMRPVLPWIFRYHARAYNRVRQKYGLVPVKDLRQMYTGGNWSLYLDIPALAPTANLPKNHRYLGPVTWNPDVPLPVWWGRIMRERPIVYVTMGSSGDMKVMRTLLAVLGRNRVSVALATAGRMETTDLPDNVFAADYLPGAAILKESALCIFNGGAATGYQALGEGVPVVGLPSNADQFYHMEAIQRAGAGILVRPSGATEKRLETAIRAVLTEESYRQAAGKLQQEIAIRPAREEFRRFVNELFPQGDSIMRTDIGVEDRADVATLPQVSRISQALRAVSESVERDVSMLESPDLVVRPIKNKDELDEVYRITHDAFLERGYCRPQADGRLVHYPRLDGIPETTVLVAIVQGEIVGTVSFTLDGPAGLHVDGDFREVCDRIRKEGKRMAGLWRIATRSRFRCEKEVVMALFRTCGHLIWDAGVEVSVYTFNPRHERIYQRLFNMTTVATNDGTKGLSNAPAVFMRLDTPNVPVPWRQGYRPGRFFPTTLKNVRMAV